LFLDPAAYADCPNVWSYIRRSRWVASGQRLLNGVASSTRRSDVEVIAQNVTPVSPRLSSHTVSNRSLVPTPL
jgi:hypothetical protein